MKISVLLPYKENFSPIYPGAVSLFVNDTINVSKFKKHDCTIFGVSKDSLESHKNWSKKLKLKFDLLSDEKKISLNGYKVWAKKKFMGREFMGTIRSTFVIEKNNIINEWRNVKAIGHAKEVLEFIENY